MSHAMPRVVLAGWLLALAPVALVAREETTATSSALLDGRYCEVPKGDTPKAKAEWAFARFHLSPDAAVARAAREAHEAGEPLGTFVLLLCHREGVAIRRDERMAGKLNDGLRARLSDRKHLSALEAYMLSELHRGGGRTEPGTKGRDDQPEGRDASRRKQWAWLGEAADKGFAQAMNDIGQAYQDGEQMEEAYAWYARAAQRGLAAGMRNQGFFLHKGLGGEQNLRKAVAITTKASKAGDVYAMINLAFFYNQGLGVACDPATAQQWITRAAESGHWMGALEKAVAYLRGNYGYDVDEGKARASLQKALETGNRRVLLRTAYLYAYGRELVPNGAKAVEFAEAAFVQGATEAAELLAGLYQDGWGDVPKDEARARFWEAQAKPDSEEAREARGRLPQLADHLSELDPFKVQLDPSDSRATMELRRTVEAIQRSLAAGKLDEAVRTAVGAIKPDMHVKHVEALLKPVTIASAYELGGGTGAHDRLYHLTGNQQIAIHYGAYAKMNRVGIVGGLSPKKPWRGVLWDPTRQEAELARDIAQKQLNQDLAAGAVLEEKYKTNPAGMLCVPIYVPMVLTLKSGEQRALTMSASGRYRRHRLALLNLHEGGQWVSQVIVDMDAKEVVPGSWTPTPGDIARARGIADPTLKDFLGDTEAERGKVSVKAWGEYDFGPTRRLLTLCYEKPDGLGARLQYRTVDMESGKLDDGAEDD